MGTEHTQAQTQTLHAEMISALQWHIDMGAALPMTDTPQNRESREHETVVTPQQQPAAPIAAAAAAPPLGLVAAKEDAIRRAGEAGSLDDLRQAIAEFDGLEVKKTATNLVFAAGNPEADVMLVGEAPGRDEDIQGFPFVGESGQLLDRMLAAIGLSRKSEDPKTSLYISNILNWRPPGNRTPAPGEVELGLPFIERHIALVRPKLLILCGGVSAKALLNTDKGVSRLRGTWHEYRPVSLPNPEISAAPIPALATFHPSYLLRTPLQKRAAWQDLQAIEARIRTTP